MQSQELAFKALQSIPEQGKVSPSCVSIRQGESEPFAQFIDRLHTALESHADFDSNMKVKLLDQLAFENANVKTKRVLCILP